MKAFNRYTVAAATMAAAAALLFASCEEGVVGIFASIAEETDVSGGMTAEFEYASPAFVARLGSAFYAGVGPLWKETGSVWSTVSAPSTAITEAAVLDGTNGEIWATAGAVAGTALYVAFTDAGTGTSLGVYATADGVAWTRADSSFPASGEYLRSLYAANGALFAVTSASTTADSAVTNAYSIYYLDGASFAPTGITANTAIGQPNAAAYDGTDYWFSAGYKLIRGTSPAALAVIAGPNDATPSSSATSTYGGLCALDAGAILVTGRSGKLHVYDGSWKSSGAYLDSDGDAYSFTVPSFVSFTEGGAAVKAILVGTDALPRSSTDVPDPSGYLEFDASSGFDPSSSPAANADYDLVSGAVNFSTTLDGLIVQSTPVFATAAGFRAFALTHGDGLWSTEFDGASWSGWHRE